MPTGLHTGPSFWQDGQAPSGMHTDTIRHVNTTRCQPGTATYPLIKLHHQKPGCGRTGRVLRCMIRPACCNAQAADGSTYTMFQAPMQASCALHLPGLHQGFPHAVEGGAVPWSARLPAHKPRGNMPDGRRH